jgi:hypothetical protein
MVKICAKPSLKSKSRSFTLHHCWMNTIWIRKQSWWNHSSWSWESMVKMKHKKLYRIHYLVYFKSLQTSNL